jgi:hypothetical protein
MQRNCDITYMEGCGPKVGQVLGKNCKNNMKVNIMGEE